MKKLMLFTLIACLWSCDDSDSNSRDDLCEFNDKIEDLSSRSFKMGFSTWSFGPDIDDQESTYGFIKSNADIYSEQIDDKIPWGAWINGTVLPEEFTNNIAQRVARKINGHQLLLSVSLLNTDRSDLLEDYDGSIPEYQELDDDQIENAYFDHLDHLIKQFNPNYLVMAMEVNDLKLKSEEKWTAYKRLMANIRSRLKNNYPGLPISESITLHNWHEPEVTDQNAYIADISNYVDQNMDFAAIAYYPFFKDQHVAVDFQQSFDFLHDQTSLPIAMVETAHLAENLEVEALDLSIHSDACEQNDYLETLLLNAHEQDYHFIIWWSFKDFDELWRTFPSDQQDIGKLWRDTGLIDQDDQNRPSMETWQKVF